MIKVAAKKKVSRFLSTCPNFQTAAHNQVCKVLAASLHKHLAAQWSLHSETSLSQTGLVLELVPTAIVLQSGRQVSDSDTGARQVSLGRCQPDFMAISYFTKKIAIGPEVCTPSETRVDDLLRLIVESCKYTNLFEQHFKTHCLRMDSPGPSIGTGHSGTCA